MNKIAFVSVVIIIISLSSIYYISYNFFVIGEAVKMRGVMLAIPYPGFLLVFIIFFVMIVFFAMTQLVGRKK